MYLFCFGLGYTSLTLARQLVANGHRVSGTCRSREKQQSLRKEGIHTYLLEDVDEQILRPVTHALVSIPPFEDIGDIVLGDSTTSLKNASDLTWVGYLSSTAVYGDWQGQWVDENTTPKPHSPRAKRRLQVEEQWLQLYHQHQTPVHIFRLSGIYGPGRNILKDIQQGTAKCIDKPGQVFSRIHVEDITQMLNASMHYPKPGNIYNLADDAPSNQLEVMQFAASLLGKPMPEVIPYAQASLTAMQQEFYAACRRVSNQKAKQQLAQDLLYPTYKEGLETLARDL